jgi:predicted restriction endonuclease
MKMLNFASLDPLIRASGRSGLGNASEGDRLAWEDFAANREAAADEVERRLEAVGVAEPPDASPSPPDPTEAIRLVRQRRGQRFFRLSVLASYRSTCCISGVTDPRLLIASHIVPWRDDERARLDPRNGLCLSSLHDRLFDAGIITVTPALRIRVSSTYLRERTDEFSRRNIHSLDGTTIRSPERFAPLSAYLEHHNRHVFEHGHDTLDP